MATDSEQVRSKLLPQQSLLRFSALNLITFVTMMAILLAFVVPFVQHQPPEVQPALLRTLGFSTAMAFIAFAIVCAIRWRIEKIGGPLVMRSATVAWIKWMFIALLAFFAIVSVVMQIKLTVITAKFINDAGTEAIMMFAIAVPICFLAYLLALIWWNVSPMSLEIRERGLVTGSLGFVPFSSSPELEWRKPKSKTAFAVLNIHRPRLPTGIWLAPKLRVSIVKASEKDAINAALRELGVKTKTFWPEG